MAGKHLQYELLNGIEKAAILMMALTPTRVQDLMTRLEDDEVERILASVARFDTVPSSTLEKVLLEFQEAIGKHEISIQGGREQAMAHGPPPGTAAAPTSAEAQSGCNTTGSR